MTKIHERTEAERLYVQDGWSVERIAESIKVHPETVRRWYREGDWLNRRKSYLETVAGSMPSLRQILSQKIDQIRSMPPEQIDASVLDGLLKLITSIEKIEGESNIYHEAIIVWETFISFIQGREGGSELLEQMEPHIADFLDHLKAR